MLLNREYIRTEVRTPQEIAELERQLVIDYSPTIRYALKPYKFVVSAHDIEELYQSAMIFLIQKYRQFDHIDDAEFNRSIKCSIRYSIVDELRVRDTLSRGRRKAVSAIRKAESHLMQKLQRIPTHKEIAEELSISVSEYHQSIIYQDIDDEAEVSEIIVEQLDTVHQDVLIDTIYSCLSTQSEDIQRIMYLEFHMGFSKQDIGKILDMPIHKIRRLREKGIEHVKKSLKAGASL